MGKNVLRLILLIISFSALSYGGFIVYQKQYFPISHQSFAPEKSVQIYVPDGAALKAKKNGLSILESYAGEDWSDLINIFLGQFEEPLSFQINIKESQKLISFKGLSNHFLEKYYVGIFPAEKGTAVIGNTTYYYWKSNEFLVFSFSEIQPRSIKKGVEFNRGNADFFFQAEDGIVEAIKLTEDVKFSAYFTNDRVLKGKSVSPLSLLSVCPTTANVVNFYGSTRFNDDANTLLNTKRSEELLWVRNEIVYIQKDDFEVLAGIQNDGSQLKNIILEAMYQNGEESERKPSIYFNNTEIIPFEVDWNWTSISGDLKTEMRYFASFNDIVFLSNSLQAMYWLLKNIQLGKTYDAFELRTKIPSRVNQLSLIKNEMGMAISSKTWINPKRSINLAAMSNQLMRSNSEQLVGEFAHIEPSRYLLYSENNNNRQIVSVHNNVLQAYDIEGEKTWKFDCNNKINHLPKIIKVGAKKSTVFLVANGDYFTLLNSEGEVFNGFNKQLPGIISNVQVLNAGSDTLFVVKTPNKVTFYNLRGSQTYPEISSVSRLYSASVGLVGEVKALTVITDNDSVFVSELKSGKKILSAKIKQGFDKQKSIISSEKLSSASLKLLTYEAGYLKMQYFSNGALDSIKLNTELKPEKTYWVNFKGKWMLVFETYNQLLIFNDLGLKEIEIAKPEPNCRFIAEQFIENEIFAFLNPESKKWHFTDEYGNLLIKNTIDNEGLSFAYGNILVSKSQNRIHIYNID